MISSQNIVSLVVSKLILSLTTPPQTIFERVIEVLPGPLHLETTQIVTNNISSVGALEDVDVFFYDSFENHASKDDMTHIKAWMVNTHDNETLELIPNSLTKGVYKTQVKWYRPGFYYIAVFYKTVRVALQSIYIKPGFASGNCVLIPNKVNMYIPTRVYTWHVVCHDAYNNPIVIPRTELNVFTIPGNAEAMWVIQNSDEGTTNLQIRYVAVPDIM